MKMMRHWLWDLLSNKKILTSSGISGTTTITSSTSSMCSFSLNSYFLSEASSFCKTSCSLKSPRRYYCEPLLASKDSSGTSSAKINWQLLSHLKLRLPWKNVKKRCKGKKVNLQLISSTKSTQQLRETMLVNWITLSDQFIILKVLSNNTSISLKKMKKYSI